MARSLEWETIRREKLKELTAPLIDFLYQYGDPYTTVIVTQTSADIVETECSINIEPRD